MESAKDLFRKRREIKPSARGLRERDELVEYFFEGCRRTWNGKSPLKIGYIRLRLTSLNKDDLYYMKSVIDSETRRGVPFGKLFFGMLKVPQYENKSK